MEVGWLQKVSIFGRTTSDVHAVVNCYAPFPLCRDPYSESSANIRIMFERTKVVSKKSSLRDKIHQNPPSLRDFSVFNHAMRNFYCTFAPVLGKATNKTEE